MNILKRICLGLALATTVGCYGETAPVVEPPPVQQQELSFEQQGRAQAYTTCDTQADCDEGLSCVNILGSNICTVTGCNEGAVCPGQAFCVVSPAIDPTGVCAAVGGDPFCARNCRDALACNLSRECIEKGCCNEVDEAGCPETCKELKAEECVLAPQCDAACCGD